MFDLDTVVRACGVLVDPEAAAGLLHLGTAWSIRPGEWLTVWHDELGPPASVRLLLCNSGREVGVEAWEQDEDSPVAGFQSEAAEHCLKLAPAGRLKKRLPLTAVGYPCVIDHSLFRLQRQHLNVERYVPYLCPWQQSGHCCLYSVEDGYLTGRFFDGMQGGPVLDAGGAVVGILSDGSLDAAELPLTRFLRLS